MFKRLAADALGLSDIGVGDRPGRLRQGGCRRLPFPRGQGEDLFLIKSKKDEDRFTNLAMVHVDGDSAMSSKRSIERYPWSSYHVSGVAIETAGTVDLDVELKFKIGDVTLSIDVRKSFLEQLKDIYKALTTIGHQQTRDEQARQHALQASNVIGAMYKLSGAEPEAVSRQFVGLLDSLNWAVLDRHTTKDFGPVFGSTFTADTRGWTTWPGAAPGPARTSPRLGSRRQRVERPTCSCFQSAAHVCELWTAAYSSGSS